MTWYAVTLNSKQVAAGEEMRLQQLFADFHLRVGAPPDLALFSHWTDDMESVVLSLTPAAEQHLALLRVMRAEPAPRPPERAALSVGHQEALARLRSGAL